MKVFLRKALRRAKRVSGATLFEYALLIGIVAISCVVVLRGIGSRPPAMLQPVNDALAQ
jgi:Flp pilus assembly pilin Flp